MDTHGTNIMQSKFSQELKVFNVMYGIPTPSKPTVTPDLSARLHQFKAMLLQEVEEVDLIQGSITDYFPGETATALILTEVSDWLGDIIVYCAGEMLRHGLPLDEVLSIIMASNASKLQRDGTALFADGKLQKGPDYWKPEPRILDALVERMK